MASEKIVNEKFATKLAQVLFSVFEDNTMTFVIGRDTRQYAYDIEKTLTQSLQSLGANVFLLGITSCSAVSFATRAYRATCGIMITGGLKPNGYIGFKIFNGNGFKITDEQISQVSYRFKNLSQLTPKTKEGSVFFKPYFNDEYIRFLKQFTLFTSKNSVKILADLSSGSAEEIYEELCSNFGIVPYLAYDGFNCEKINEHYLKAQKQKLVQKFEKINYDGKKEVVKDFFDYKIVFSGDCDKLLFFDKTGKKIDNDLLFALFCVSESLDREEFVATTNLYTNQNVFEFLVKSNINFEIAPSSISEKNLVQTMLEKKSVFGGDKFGNFIFLDIEKTSSAFLILIKFLNILTQNPKLVVKVLSLKLVKNEERDYTICDDFDFELLGEKILIYENLLEHCGKILIRQDKLIRKIHFYIESDNELLKSKIFEDFENFLIKQNKKN